MISFFVAIALLVLGYLFYGLLIDKVFGVDPKAATPAISKADGVDFVPMKPWRIFLVQFLNIAGLGPIFGAVMGIFYGPAAFLWIVFGTIFAGGVHDYLSGMLSVKKDGISMPEIVGQELGGVIKIIIRVLSIVLLILLTASFLSGVAVLLQTNFPIAPSLGDVSHPVVWLSIVMAYFIFATVLPVDKLIGRFYPIFGGVLLFMGIGIMFVMLLSHPADMPSVTDGLADRSNMPIFPMMFVSIACGAISGFHSTQSPLMARCVTSQKQGRAIFYGAMVCEGILALIWAAAAGTFFADPDKGLDGIAGLQAFAAEHKGENIPALVVDKICHSWLGTLGGILAVIGVIAAPITSGDTALRSARLMIADFMHLNQKPIKNRMVIAIPLFVTVIALLFIDFNAVWRYFSWSNQTLAMFLLWAGAVYLYKQEHAPMSQDRYKFGFLMPLIPAIFMTMVSVSYILVAPEGFNLIKGPEEFSVGARCGFAYATSAVVAAVCLAVFCIKMKKVRLAR